MGSLYDDAVLLLGFPPEIYNAPPCIVTFFVAEEDIVKLPPEIVAFEDVKLPLNVPLTTFNPSALIWLAVNVPVILAALTLRFSAVTEVVEIVLLVMVVTCVEF